MNMTMLEQNTEVLRRTSGKWVDKRLVLLTAAQFAAKQESIDVEGHRQIALELRGSSTLKWSKDMAITLASIFASQAIIESSSSLTAAVQAMIQAQQAVIAASTASAVASSSSSG
jgi:hypothetical protein